MTSALDLRDELLFCRIFAIIGKLRLLIVFFLDFAAFQRVVKFINVDARGLSIPRHVHVLYEAVKAAKLGKVPILV